MLFRSPMNIMNRIPSPVVHGMIPEEKYTGRKPNISHLKVFGCIAYVHVLDERRSKLDPKVEKCIFIGYSLQQKGYRCYNPSTHKMQVSRDVVFDEMSCWYGPTKVRKDVDAGNGNAATNIEQQSQSLSGPSESSNNESNAWIGRLQSSGLGAQIVVPTYHAKERRRWTMHLYLMFHVVIPMLM